MARAVATNRTALDEKNRELNVKTMNDPQFKKACEDGGVKPSARQARKFRQGRGAASKAGNKA